MSHHNYKEVAQLDLDQQRLLLQKGDAVERVWAAWALGIRLGSGSISDLSVGLNESPEAGTRRHILVMLAGFGEREILRVFAQDDPDEYVRATACQYLIQISPPDDLAVRLFLRDRILQDSSSVVRLSILRQTTPEFLALQIDELSRMIDDDDLDVRKYATDFLLATTTLDQLFPGVLENHIRYEPDKDFRQYLLGLSLKADGKTRLLLSGQELSIERKEEILRFLVDHQSHFTWDSLKSFTVSEDFRHDHLLTQLLAPTEAIKALPWLIHLIARASDWPKPRNQPESQLASVVRTSASDAIKLLIASISQLQTIRVVSLGQETINAASKYLQEIITELDWASQFDERERGDVDWYKQAIQARQQLMDILKAIKTD
jgi:hypothetical protein